MKKHITGILISLLVLSTMSGCGKDKKITYMDEQATTSDATNASEIHLNYDIADERMSFTIDADVDTALSNQSAPVAKASRCDYTDDDIKRIADAIFDTGSYSLFIPYAFRSMEDVKSACDIMQEEIAQYSDIADVPYTLLQECYDAQKRLEDGFSADPIQNNGELKWYTAPVSDNSNIDINSQFCTIKGTVNNKPYYLSFTRTDSCCMMVLHANYEPYTPYAWFLNQDANAVYENDLFPNECQYSQTDAKSIVLDTLQTIGITDYQITDIREAQTAKTNYEISSSGQVAESQINTDSSYDSYLLYGGRVIDNLSPIHTDANFSSEITPETADENEDPSTSYTDTKFGFEAVIANVGNDGINYLIVQNPMKVDEILETKAHTLSFDQIDAIAQDYITKHDGSNLPYYITGTYMVHDIQYGLIRVSDEDTSSYMYIPAWYYMVDGESSSTQYCTFSSYVIISAIDGSIYNNYSGDIN